MAKNIAPVPANGGAPKPSVKFRNASGENSKSTTLVPKKNIQAADPAAQPMATRQYAPKERSGAAYGLRVNYQASVAPEAGATQANGRLFKAAINRTAPNFSMGMMDHD